MIKILDDNIIITGSGIFVTAESTNPFEDFSLSTRDKISLFTEDSELYISVEENEYGEITIYGYVNSHTYPYIFLNKENIKEDIENVIKEFV